MDESMFKEVFFQETDEYLQRLDDAILELEKNPEDESIIDEIFRAAHTLKGMAATMGYDSMTQLTHTMENVFELFRKKEVEICSDIISLLFKTLDKLEEIVEDIRSGENSQFDISELIFELDSVGNNKIIKKVTKNSKEFKFEFDELQVWKDQGYTPYKIEIKLLKESGLKGARAFLILNDLKNIGEIIDTDPINKEIMEGNFDTDFKVILVTDTNISFIQEVIQSTPEVEELNVEEIKIDKIENEENSKIEDIKINEKKSISKNNNKQSDNQFIRVDLERLDKFMNLVSELVIYRTRLEDIAGRNNIREIDEPLNHVGQLTSELQKLVLNIRMQPLSVVLNRYPRMVRDLSKEMGKEINFTIEGEETELDKTVVSEIGEPLVHLIRNAVDHGIETVEERIKKGKSKEGNINLTAYLEGDKVVIIVEDDGKGMSPDVIKKSAELKGINTENMSEKDYLNLIFHNGFSTAKEVTDISGRGVGMNVVREKIYEIGGEISVESEIDKGSKFIIKLPLTLSIIQTLMVEVGKEKFAIPLSIIDRLLEMDESLIKETHNKEVYLYNEKIMPLIRLSEKFEIDIEENNNIVVVTIEDNQYGIVVSNLIGQQEIVIKDLGYLLSSIPEYVGATVLGDGSIVLILDIANIINSGDYVG